MRDTATYDPETDTTTIHWDGGDMCLDGHVYIGSGLKIASFSKEEIEVKDE